MNTLPTMQQLLEAGVHFGHQTRRGHPKMNEYIFGARDGVHIINLEQSEKLLKEAAVFAQKLGEEGKTMLFVGTKKQAQPIVKELAESVGAFYVDFKWMGGLLTNFDEIRRNINKLLEMKEKQAKEQFEHYTKKERLLISRKVEKFDREQGGIAKMEKLPDALFIVDCVAEKTAIAEATRMNIPTIAITDTNSNPMMIIHPIPGNDDATKSIYILTEAVANSFGEGLKKAGKEVPRKAKVNSKDTEVPVETEQIKAEAEAIEEIVEKKETEESSRKEE